MKPLVKRVLLAVAVLVVLFLVAVGSAFGAAFAGGAPLPESGPIAGGKALLVKDGYVSMYLVPTTEGHALAIDGAMDPEAKALDAVLAEKKLTLDAFFVTHGHGDHLGACRKHPDVPVYALADEVGIIGGTEASRGPLQRVMGPNPFAVKVAHPLKDGDVTEVGGKSVRVFAMPGHTRGSAAYLVDGVLFFGDIAGHATDGDKVTKAPWVFSDDPATAAASIRAVGQRLTPADVQFFTFAHQAPMAADLTKLAQVQ